MNVLEIKAAVRKRDGYCCTACGMTRAAHFAKYERDLEVHRLDPGSKYTMEGCVTVCRECHGPLPRSPHGSLPDGRLALHPVLRRQLEELCDRNVSTLTSEITIAIREHLRANGLWPPPSRPPADGKGGG